MAASFAIVNGLERLLREVSAGLCEACGSTSREVEEERWDGGGPEEERWDAGGAGGVVVS